ncbi:tetratricopeptide repeat protein [Caminibacter mediatlanticus]|uniref:beta-lactamase n=1 Tax=Caminibacter mediatlanticus TB-2 TaxID=391592 RepID=A0AAI9AHS3_9BACT|nr:SEL1-like repeat protein [Caminibacter mediatlanticus]EDM23903.1 hypothetical protein CMTB2_06606 [Caminibacter mediatlanticus TB-2]
MKKIILVILFITSIFAIDFTFTKAYQYFKKGEKLEKTNPQKAQEYFQKSYILLQTIKERPSSQIYFMLGKMYLNGWGVEQNFSIAEKYFKQSIKLGNTRAYCCLAKLYIKTNKKQLAKKYLNLAIKNNYFCNKVDMKNLKIKKD